jgi:hypothetical protein
MLCPVRATDPDSRHGRILRNLDLFMHGMRAAGRAEFLDRELLRLALLVAGGVVIAAFATVARQADQVSHVGLPLPLRDQFKAHDGNRTRDLFLTKEVLYRLSYMGKPSTLPNVPHAPRAAHWSGKRDSNPRPRAWKARALPTELFPLSGIFWWRGEDSNLRRHKPADLQSAPFGHSGTSPQSRP